MSLQNRQILQLLHLDNRIHLHRHHLYYLFHYHLVLHQLHHHLCHHLLELQLLILLHHRQRNI